MTNDLSSFLKSSGSLRDNLRFEPNSEFEKTVKDWAEERIEVARKILEDTDRNSTGALAKSVFSKPYNESEGKMIVEILADSYWKFINHGVNGVFNSRGSQYSFKNLGVGRAMKDSFRDFIKNRGITSLNYTNSKGESKSKPMRTEKDYDGLAYVLAKSVKKKGIEGNEFMDIAFSAEALKDLGTRIEKDVVSFFSL